MAYSLYYYLIVIAFYDRIKSEYKNKILSSLNKKGNTIILVTHEEDIAKYAKRRVRLKDGLILSDGKD